jgi:phosphatidylinositol-3,4,5-trisphosphate 3-phosphatase/dual-specificity protein phosphatase PTEN
MNILREWISGKKQRFKDNQFNLDLTYITPRIIVMSFPASGLEAMYRNSIKDVSKFLALKHSTDYKVYNLSGRAYDYAKFNNNVDTFKLKVEEHSWKDHHSPSLYLLFTLCESIQTYLRQKDSNTVVVHCLAGKGRSGTAICCFLLFSGQFNTVQEALIYYAAKRFHIYKCLPEKHFSEKGNRLFKLNVFMLISFK